MPLAFVTDTVTHGDAIVLFRLGRVDFPISSVDTPWGEKRSVSAYEEHNGVCDLAMDGDMLRSELLRGFTAARARPTLGTTIARRLPAAIVKRFEEAVDALLGCNAYRFQPVGCHALVEMHPSWVELRNDNGTIRVAVVGETVRVGHDDVNALVWTSGAPKWSLGHVTADN